MIKFLCDEMLTGLGRWLRIAGYDTEIVAAGTPDNDIVNLLNQNDRCFLTCDSELARRLKDKKLIMLENSEIENSVRSLNQVLHLDWLSHSFQRCSLCNSPIESASEEMFQDLEIKLDKNKPINYCSHCNKLYWEGSHVKRILNKLKEFQQTQ